MFLEDKNNDDYFNSSYLEHLIISMLLCTEASTIYNYVTNEYNFESKSKIEETILNFCHLCDYTYDTEPLFEEIKIIKTKIKVFILFYFFFKIKYILIYNFVKLKCLK